MIKKIFYIFIFFAPFTSFFAVSAWLRIPVIADQLLLLFILMGIFIHQKIKSIKLFKEDLLLIAFLILVWLSFLLGFREKRSFHHSLAYTNSILFFFFLSKYAIELLRVSVIDISKIVYKSFIVISVIIITDFIGKNYFNLSLRDVFSKVDGVTSNMDYFIRQGFYRVGGVAEEPGHMAIFYNIYFSISLVYINKKKYFKKYIWIFALFIICQFALYSNAGIGLSILALIIIYLINKLKSFVISKRQIFWIVSIFSIVIISLLAIYLFEGSHSSIISNIRVFMDKIMFQENKIGSSSGARLHQWSRALTNFTKHPFLGSGPGYGVQQEQEGYLSVYLTILSDIGFIAFLLFILFQIALFIKVMKINGNLRDFILYGVITSFLHLFVIADFYSAPIWILFIFVQLVYKEEILKY